MALAEALKINTTLERLESAALPSNPLVHAFSPAARTLAALAPSHPSFCRVRRLQRNKLGPEGGMALAEALKSNTTLKELGSAALPSIPLVHAFSPRSAHACCTCSCSPSLLPCAQALRQQSRPRGRHGARRGAQEQHDPRAPLVCCPAIEPIRSCLAAAPSHSSLLVTGWWATTISAAMPSRPSERRPAAASSCTSSER